MAAMASSTAPLPAVALLSRSQEGSHTPEWTVLCCQTPHCLMLLVVTYILFYILAALSAKSGRWERWIFPFTLGESAWAIHSFLFWIHCSLQYGTKHFFLPCCSSVTCSGALFHCCHTPGSLSHGQALGHSSANSWSRCAPCLQAGVESRLCVTPGSLQGTQQWLRWVTKKHSELCCCSQFTCALIKASQICVSLWLFPAYLLAQHSSLKKMICLRTLKR